jgi:potassium efflux system protein
MPTISEFLQLISRVWEASVIHIEGRTVSVGNLLAGIFVITLGFWSARKLSNQFAKKVLARFIDDKASQNTIETLTFYFLLIVFSLLGLSIANIPMAIFTVAGGALAIGVGFGSQNVVNNFLSGIILMIERPISVGDFVELDGVFGSVQRIGFRSTTVLAVGNRQMIVPNSSFLQKNVLNWTLSDKLVRVQVTVGVAYESDPRKVETLLLDAVQNEKHILKTPEPLILFKNFADSTLEFEVTFSIELDELRDMEWAASNLRFAIAERFRAAGIVMAFPQRDVHLSSLSPIDVRLHPDK